MTTTTNTTTHADNTRTGVESIDCPDCGALHLVDYDTHNVELALPDARSTTLDDDGLSFDCMDCGAKVPA